MIFAIKFKGFEGADWIAKDYPDNNVMVFLILWIQCYFRANFQMQE